MDNKKENREYDRDNDNQRQDRDQNQQQAQNRDQSKGGYGGSRNSDDDNDMRNNDPDSNRDIESRWQDIESDYRRRYPNLTDEDVDYRQGDFDNMTDRIGKRTNRSRQQVSDEISNWDSNDDSRI